ncbi:class I SAM-dependent methyltransferase [Algoriphagus sp. CAU 1675]|uniref:class I SAM-dependent methyltransferase n=1 Tax=Algoriphagus sp. CAU 1675 TaxID=3032597 RepID=UPI0023DAC325|nr:class I SAM-dependent methyltransferase [Algoriphagus sp. CAU 1675]MDF2156265.1 class I SAM-dependent methyltransferase [Algoriphagus sp. CAU 1675]
MSNCKFCKSTDLTEFTATERMLGLGGDFVYQECRACGSLQLKNIPEDLSPYYSDSVYYSFSPLVKSSLFRKVLKRIRLRAFFWFRLEFMAPVYGYWLKKIHPGFQAQIADVGCGNGQLLYELHASGYNNLFGFDPFLAKSFDPEKGLVLKKGSIKDSDRTFDLIMMHHSFEHMEFPEQVLSDCFDRLRPGGKLLIRTPVADAAIWKEKRALWVQLDAPRHLVIPTIKGFRTLAEQQGFRLLEVEFDSDEFQFWGTQLYESGQKLDRQLIPQYIDQKLMALYKEKALLFNREGQGDQVCFYLQKPV